MLKGFVGLTENSIFWLRIFSFLGVLATFALALFPLRRLFGKTTAFSFILLFTILPVTQYLGVEIRMYSWAMFFVLACAIYAYDTYLNDKLLSFAFMTFFGICSIYIHNYGVIATGIIYIILLIASYKKNKHIRNVIISAIIILLAYGPWIPVILYQMQQVQSEYWIKPLTPKDILLLCYYFFSPKEPSHSYTVFSVTAMSIGLAIMLTLIGIMIAIIIKKHFSKPYKKLIPADMFILVYLLTIIVTLAISFFIKPISVSRYTNCVLGPLLLGMSVYITQLFKEKYKILIGLIFTMLLVLSVTRIFSETAYARNANKNLEKIREFLNEKDSPKLVIAAPQSYVLMAELSALIPEKRYVIYSPYGYKRYRPFQFDVIKFIPDSLSFFQADLITVPDSVKIKENYKTEKELSFPKFNLYLLKPSEKTK